MNSKQYLIGAGIIVVLFVLVGISTSGSGHVAVTNPSPSVSTASKTTTVVAPSGSQSAEDVVPGLYPNPITNAATTKGIKISSILTENNVDAAGNAVSDHLELTIKNLTSKPLSNLESYYTVTDVASGKKEGYYKKLSGLTVPAQGSVTIHFDGKSEVNHYGVNMHGIYGTTVDTLAFHVEISAPGYAPVYADATKAPGGAEVVGQ